MSFLLKRNNARTTISQSGGLLAGSLLVTVADASAFPLSGNFLITIWDSVQYPDPTDDPNVEILLVTSVSGNTFTIVRSQEATNDAFHSNGHMVAMLITAGIFEEIENTISIAGNIEIIGENLSGQVDGIQTIFTLANNYVANSTKLFINGLRATRNEDYIEKTVNTIEIPIVVTVGEKVVIDYYQV